MEAITKQRNIRMPARKIRRVINQVRGKSVQDAVNILKFMPYFAAKIVEKNIKCAAANAVEKWGVNPDELIVIEVYADDGPTYKRVRPRAQGRAYQIKKRTSHITVKVKISEKLKEKIADKQKIKQEAKKEQPKKSEKKQEVKAASEEVKKTKKTKEKKQESQEEVKTEEIIVEKTEKIEEESNQSEQTVETTEITEITETTEKAEISEENEQVKAGRVGGNSR